MHILLIQILTKVLDCLPFLMAMEDLNALNSVKDSSQINSENKLSSNLEKI